MRIKSLIPVFFVLAWQASFYFDINNWYILIGTLPLAGVYWRKFLNDRKWFFSFPLFLALVAMLILPASLTHTLTVTFSEHTFINALEYSLILSVSLVPIIYGGLMDIFPRKPVYGMVLSGIAYFLVITPVIRTFTATELAKLLLYSLGFDLVFSFYVAYLYLAENRKVLGPFLFFLMYSSFSFIDITEKVSPLFNLVWEVISVSILFWATYFAMGENLWVRRLLKSKRRVHFRKKRKPTDIIFAVLIALIAILAIGGYYTHTLAADPTSSMYPIIKPGSLLIVKPASPDQVAVGEIIEFHAPWDNGTLYAHEAVQLIDMNNTIYFKTRGVNNPVDDPGLVPGSDLVGIVVLHVPYLGYPIIYGRVTAAALMVLILGSMIAPKKHGRGRPAK